MFTTVTTRNFKQQEIVQTVIGTIVCNFCTGFLIIVLVGMLKKVTPHSLLIKYSQREFQFYDALYQCMNMHINALAASISTYL